MNTKLTPEQVKEYALELHKQAAPLFSHWNPVETLKKASALRVALKHASPSLPEAVGCSIFRPGLGICVNISNGRDNTPVIDLVGLTALQFDWCCMDLPRANFGLPVEICTYPVEGVDAYCRTVNLWEGEGLRRRLQLLDAVIEVLEYVCDMEDEL